MFYSCDTTKSNPQIYLNVGSIKDMGVMNLGRISIFRPETESKHTLYARYVVWIWIAALSSTGILWTPALLPKAPLARLLNSLSVWCFPLELLDFSVVECTYVTEIMGLSSVKEGIYVTKVLEMFRRRLTFAGLDLSSFTFLRLIIILNQPPAPIPINQDAEIFTNPCVDQAKNHQIIKRGFRLTKCLILY